MKRFLLGTLLFILSINAKGQNITKFEYFIDTDPGIGLATASSPTASPTVTDFNIPISVALLSNGFHTLYIRGQNTAGDWTQTHFRTFYIVTPLAPPPTTITQVEYFVDTDPGIGAATQVSGITPAATISNLAIDITTTAYTPGFHTLYVRAKTAAGDWTQTHFRTFYIVAQLAPPPTTITQVEYFVDTDPGIGVATQVSGITPTATMSNLAVDISAASYTLGFHTLYIRAKTAAGNWTQTHFRSFYITSLPTADNLVKFEYFFDTDPGFDNGTPAPIAPPALSVSNQDIFAVPSSLSIGTHTIYVRAKDSSGDWTQVSTGTFSVTGLPTITGFAPISGPIGITVTITGTNFDTTPANNTVAFNGTTSVVTASTATSITTTVPVGATTGTISVTVGGNTATSGSSFTVTTSPIPFTGLKLWLRADDLTLPDNSPVSLWPDASGLGQDFSGTGATRPTFRTNGCPSLLNSRPYIQYSSQGLKRDDVIGLAPNTPRTIIAIYRMKSISQREFVIEQGDFSTPGTYFGLDANSYGTHGNRFGVYATNNSYDASLATDSSYHIHFLTANTMAIGTNIIGDVEYRIDNNLQVLTPDVLNGGNYASFATANEMRVQGGNVDLAEVIIYNRPLSTAERNDIVAYLQGKYGSFPIAPPLPAPTITSFSPSSASAGSSITIIGTNFDPVPTNNIVEFNGVTAVVTASSSTSIITTVPVGATTGPISVSISGCTADVSPTNFTVIPSISITTQPSDFTACVGGIATFTTAATGATNISYQWQYSPDGIASYTDLTNTGGYSNVSTSVFMINSIGNFGAGFYRCKINGDFATTVYSNLVSFTVNALPTSPAAQNVNFCAGNTATLTASGGANGQYVWFDPNAAIINGQSNSTYTTPALTATTNFSVAINNGTCQSLLTPVTATISTNACSSVVIDSTPLVTEIGGKITLDLKPLIKISNGTLDLTSLKVVVPPSSGATSSIDANGILTIDYVGISFAGGDKITITACDLNGQCSTQDFSIDVAGDIIIYNGISPSGANPKLILQYIEVLQDTKNNSVHIFDRWENQVWHGANYDNASVVFTGISDGGGDLPSGVYFYKIDFASGKKTKTGFLSLRR